MAGLDLDFLTRIVNVHWGGGGVYVAGSQWFFTNPSSDVWINKIASKTEDLTKWKKTISTPHGGDFMPSAFPGSGVFAKVGVDKKPVFVLGGLADTIETGDPFAARIMTSKNGSAWTMQTIGSWGEVYLVTWNENEKAFYAGMRDYSHVPDIQYDVAFRSVDGLGWAEIGRIASVADEINSPVEQYCSDKVTDINGHKVPTSIFGYDEKNDILITPDPVHMTFGISYPAGEPTRHGDRLKIVRGPDNDTPGSTIKPLPGGMNRVWAVAYAAGIWQAAGQTSAFPEHGVIATSVDDGDTWTITLTGVAGSAFTNVAAGTVATTEP